MIKNTRESRIKIFKIVSTIFELRRLPKAWISVVSIRDSKKKKDFMLIIFEETKDEDSIDENYESSTSIVFFDPFFRQYVININKSNTFSHHYSFNDRKIERS